MLDFTDVKIEIFIPEVYIEALRDELHRVNVGKIGDYDHCMSITTVRGYWRPLVGAEPYQGEIGQISEGYECKVEVNCKREYIRDALKVIKTIHPYDEPLINIVPLVNHLFEEVLPGV
ncbi:MAG: cytochrome C biogenesis protein [Anaerolineae bacterium]|nr:cytochrome C biogenesis protein [Anaerolineae bacterium]